MTNPDERHAPHLRAVDEPPYDPAYDEPRINSRTPPNHAASEQAVLKTLLVTPEHADQLAHELDGTDFYRPIHERLWDTWHALRATDGVPPDAITFQAHLQAAGDVDAVRALVEVLVTDTSPALVDQYARTVRDLSRLRDVTTIARSLDDLVSKAKVDQVETVLGEALQKLDETVMRFGPRTTRPATTGLADLTWVLGGRPPQTPPPTWGRRVDGTALFYTGRHNGVFGDPEGGKTWLAQVAGVEAMNDGHTFAMIDVDHNGQDHTAARLLLLGARPDHIADPDRFRYYEPEDADQLRAAVTDITTRAPAVVVIDSIGEVLPMLGVKSVDNDEITAALREIVMPPAKAGSCVISVDHLPKSAEARTTGYAIGGTAKKRAVDGAYLRVEAKVQPAPGGVGRITLRIEKDRLGELRKSSGGGYAGTFVLDSTLDHVTTWRIGQEERPTNPDGSFRPTSYMDKVAHYVADNDGCTQNDIERDIPGTAKFIREALQILITEGHITRQPGPRRSWLHTLTIPYREAEDDRAQPTL